jgi:hypothetical protein
MGLHAKDKQLLIKIQNKFNTGYTRTAKDNPIFYYEVGNLLGIREKIIPFFELYPLNNIKHNDFLDFKKKLLP